MSAALSYDDIWHHPKTDLHRHLDGAVRPEVLLRLARHHGVVLPTEDLETFRRMYQIRDPLPIDELLKRFGWAIAVMRTPEGLEECAYQAVLDAAEENILYLELRFAPGYHSRYLPPWYISEAYEETPFRPMTLDDTVEAVLRGIARGFAETGVVANLTLCIPRECIKQYGMACAQEIARTAIRFQDRGVVALDLACDEATYPPHPFAKVFRDTRGSRIHRDPHAGEMGKTREERIEHIWSSVHQLHADGLGHAYDLHHSGELLSAVWQRKIRIERHPLGVFAPPLAESGLDALLKRGILVSIMSDDPVLYQQTLSENILAVIEAYGWNEFHLQWLVANSVKGAFFSSPEQERFVLERFAAEGFDIRLLDE